MCSSLKTLRKIKKNIKKNFVKDNSLTLATKLFNNKNYEEAVKYFEKYLNSTTEKNSDIYFMLGISYFQLLNFNKAIENYSKAIEIKETHTLYNNRGIAYAELKLFNEAISDYSKAIEINPNYPLAYNNKANAEIDLKLYDEAILDYSKAIEIEPNYEIAYYNRGVAKANLNKFDEALLDYNKAIEINPNYIDPYYNRAILKENNNELEDAISDYDKIIELAPNFSLAYYNRGILYLNLKNYEEAIKNFQKTMELDPQYLESYFRIIDIYIEQQDLNQALFYINNVQKIDPNNQKIVEYISIIENLQTNDLDGKNERENIEINELEFSKKYITIFSLYQNYKLNINTTYHDFIKLENNITNNFKDIKIYFYIDNIVLISENLNQLNEATLEMYSMLLKMGYLFKGGMGYGDLYFKDNFLTGKIINEINSWINSLKEFTILYTPSLIEKIDENLNNIMKKSVAIDDKFFNTYMINWGSSKENIDSYYTILKNEILTPELLQYHSNTEQYLKNFL